MAPTHNVFVRHGSYRGWWCHLYVGEGQAAVKRWRRLSWVAPNGGPVTYEVAPV